jgi:anti-anti-sigma regulatory factor
MSHSCHRVEYKSSASALAGYDLADDLYRTGKSPNAPESNGRSIFSPSVAPRSEEPAVSKPVERLTTFDQVVNEDPAASLMVQVLSGAVLRHLIATGELDGATSARLYEACVSGPRVPVTVDLGRVTFMDCGGHAGLDAAQQLLTSRGQSMTIQNYSGQPAKLLRDHFLTSHASISDEAVAGDADAWASGIPEACGTHPADV